jgi:IS1 family transposase
MYLSTEKAELILKMLVEGSSVSTVERITGVHHRTILKLLVNAARRSWAAASATSKYAMWKWTKCGRLSARRKKRVRPEDDQNLGDCYTFVAIERNTKLVLNIAMGKRDQATTDVFVEGVRQAIAPGCTFQVTTDGFAPYRTAIPNTMEDVADSAILIKVYRAVAEGERRYSPAEVSSVEVVSVKDQPDPARICASIVERSNLSVRMGTRRFTRLTNAFSKQWENHWAAVSFWYAFYNFCRIHKSLRVTPVMAAGISDHVWDVAELLQ